MIKIKDIVNSQTSLQKLLGVSLPVKVSYKLSKLVAKLQPELDIFNKEKDKLIEKYGEKDDKGNWTIKQDSENMPKFVEEINELTEMEVNIDFGDGKPFEKISVADLGDVKIEAQDLLSLSYLLND